MRRVRHGQVKGPPPRRRALGLWMGIVWVVFASAFPGCFALYAPSSIDDPPEYCTVFNYMVKSGGTSVKKKLVGASRTEHTKTPGVCVSNGRSPVNGCLKALYESPVIFGYGEVLRIPFKHVARSCEYFTIMRHPIDRLVSAFFFCPTNGGIQAKPEKWCGHAEVEEPATDRLLDYARNRWSNKAFQQMMISFRCPWWLYHLCADDPDVREVPRADLTTPEGREALQRVQTTLKSYKAVGIAEEWDLTMALFDASVSSPVRHWNGGPAHEAEPTTALRQEVLEWAYLSPEVHGMVDADMLLYEMAVSLFKNQTSTVLGVSWD